MLSTWPPIRSVMAGPLPLYGTCRMSTLAAREHLAGQVLGRAVAGRAHGDVARLGLGQGDQLRQAGGLHGWIDHEHQRHGADDGHRREALLDVVGDAAAIQGGIDRMAGQRAHQQGVAVGGALATWSAPILPAAPAFSTTTVCPSAPVSSWASTRPITSVAPPGIGHDQPYRLVRVGVGGAGTDAPAHTASRAAARRALAITGM